MTDQLLARFDTVRARATRQGRLRMPIQGLALVQLKAIGTMGSELTALLQPRERPAVKPRPTTSWPADKGLEDVAHR